MKIFKNAFHVFFIFLIINLGFNCNTPAQQSFVMYRYYVKDAKAILIRGNRRDEELGNSLKGDEALLITDKDEINKFALNLDSTYYVKREDCDFEWQLTFWKSPVIANDVYISRKCEEPNFTTTKMHNFLKPYLSSIISNPKFFITNIEIPNSLKEEDALRLLEEDGQFRVFTLGGMKPRLPSLTIAARVILSIPDKGETKEDALKLDDKFANSILANDLRAIESNFVVKDLEELPPIESKVEGQTGRYVQVKIYFSKGANLAEAKKQLKFAKVTEENTPNTYFVQLVGTERCTKEFADKLKAKFSFIKNAFAYPSEN